ncbi:MAG: polysaccharide deacetylase family protein [Rhodocyclaceae bacterium]|jgi:peptidoglycan/xylan/chitin deacetylase (PgdA/CDA1 family)
MIAGLPFLAWPGDQQLSILIYHRVLSQPDPLRPGEPDVASFDWQMRLLAEHCVVLPLREAVSRLQEGGLPHRACCITFDDGYADNLTVALPILEKYRLPATVFVATGYLDGGRMFNDAVIDAIAAAPGGLLDLADLDLGRHQLSSLEQRRAAIAVLLEQLKYRSPQQRAADVERLVETSGCGALPRDIMLTSTQVGDLARRGIEIGGHTDSHAILTTLVDEQARAEIQAGRERLEALTDKPVTVFAYPNGRPHRDYEARHAVIVRELGFELAVSTARGVANRTTDLYQLPRFTPWDRAPAKWGLRLLLNARTGKAMETCQ